MPHTHPHLEILISGDGRTLVVVPDNSFRINDTFAVAITALRTGRGIWGYQKTHPPANYRSPLIPALAGCNPYTYHHRIQRNPRL